MRCQAAVLLAMLFALPSQATVPEILWRDIGHTRPSFLPEAVLLMTTAVPDDVAAEVRAAVHHAKTRSQCTPLLISDGGGEGWRSLDQKLQAGFPTFIGRVIGLVPGWDVYAKQVATLARVEVAEVLVDPKQQLAVGEEVTYLLEGGDLTIKGVRICTERRASLYLPKIGEELVVTARATSFTDTANPKHMRLDPRENIYPIRDGEAVVFGPQPDGGRSRLTLSEIREIATHRRSVQP
jgi:hypothetical protein